MRYSRRSHFAVAAAVLLVSLVTLGARPIAARGGSYSDLVSFFDRWRAFAAPRIVDGVPDYSAAAMAEQYRELGTMQTELGDFDVTAWPVAEQVDWHLVRAEMNGLEFDHRVRRPWANDPAFYVSIFPAQSDVPAHEGPVIHGWIDLWTYDYPLSAAAAAELTVRIGAIPALLDQARNNLVGNGRDLWLRGIGSIRTQHDNLVAFAERVAGSSDALAQSIEQAVAASARFADWLEAQAPGKTGPSGVGKKEYTWALQNVHYLPYTWEQVETLMRRELWRAHTALRLEENHHRDLPTLQRYSTPAEYDSALNAAVDEYMDFLESEDILSVRPYMAAALRARIGSFSAPSRADGLRGFFSEVQYRDGVVMRTHGYHWFDLARMQHEPHASPIRHVPLLFNLWDARSEGMATSVEEMMLHAGLFDGRPRARELIWILLAQRAARSIGGLMMHANEWSMQQAVQFASRWTPRGWLPADGDTVWGEQHLYLQQPVYGVSYLIGKIEIEKLLAERSVQLGDGFSVHRFMDEFEGTGVIPVSLARWELTGNGDEVRALTSSR